MTNSYIEFPKLGIHLNINSIAFSIGSKPIYWYGIIIATGLLVAMIVVINLAKKYDISAETIYDVVIFGTPAAVICARFYYVAFQWQDYKDNLSEIYKIWHGGIAIYGAIIGAVISTVVYCRVKKQNLALVCDVCSIGLVIGQIFGRWGNFFNQEAFGTNTDSVFGMTGDIIKQSLEEMELAGQSVNHEMCVHPTFLYESLWNVGVLIALVVIMKRRKFDGQVFLSYLTLYGLGRFFIEGLRTDSLLFAGFRVSQIVAFVTVIFGIALIVWNIKKDNKTLTLAKDK